MISLSKYDRLCKGHAISRANEPRTNVKGTEDESKGRIAAKGEAGGLK